MNAPRLTHSEIPPPGKVCGRLAIVFLCMVCPAAPAQPAGSAAHPPAEETRLDQDVFREGLKKRGLTELLELHLRDYPPAGTLDSLLLQRDVKLTLFADDAQPVEVRRSAVAEANHILEALIERYPDDPRSFEWRFDLARSLLYDEGESLISKVLYRGLNTRDRRSLLDLTGRTIQTLSDLLARLSLEYERIDNLPVPQFEQLERSGYIERVDDLEPKADYLLLWARLYDALPRYDSDRMRARRLSRIEDYLKRHPAVLDTPHETSRIQVQALTLAGMTYRLLNRHSTARQYLDRALATAKRIKESDEQARVQWAVTLARIETARNERDEGNFRTALKIVERFVRDLDADGDAAFGMELVGAVVERSIHRAQARTIADPDEAAKARDRAWQPLARLTRRHPERRDEVYATLFSAMDPDTPPDALDPFEQSAAIAGLLTQLGEHPQSDDPRLARLAQLGEAFLSSATPRVGGLLPEVVFNLGVAAYRAGRNKLAVERFLQVARNHITWEKSLQAAVYAVQLASASYEQNKNNEAAQAVYRKSLDTLVTFYPQSDAALYWRFFYAQFLDEMGEFDAAAAQYAQVNEKHEHFIEAVFSRARCLALALEGAATETPGDLLALRSRADDFFTVYRDFLSRAGGMLSNPNGIANTKDLNELLSRAKVIGAEVLVLPCVNRANQALESLDHIEAELDEASVLLGRVWRVRLLAYEQLGQFEEAAQAIPAYVSADPQHAGPTMQGLYSSLAGEAKTLRARGDDAAANRKAEVALILARQIRKWTEENKPGATPEELRAVALQLAEATLAVGRFKEARNLFATCLRQPGADGPPADHDEWRVQFGFAESQFQLGEWQDALIRFNRLAVSMPMDHPIRWRALLRDLQCRTALNHAPQDIIKVIEQQRHLYPDLGGSELAAEFDKLQRENQRRADRG